MATKTTSVYAEIYSENRKRLNRKISHTSHKIRQRQIDIKMKKSVSFWHRQQHS